MTPACAGAGCANKGRRMNANGYNVILYSSGYMKKTVSIVIIFILLFGAFLIQAVGAGSSATYKFSDQEINELLAPIALYPDPLLAVMLPASTYPEEIDEAEAWLKKGGTVSDINEHGGMNLSRQLHTIRTFWT